MTEDTLRKISGALKSTIDAHGNITLQNYSSAAKRIYGELIKNGFQENKETSES